MGSCAHALAHSLAHAHLRTRALTRALPRVVARPTALTRPQPLSGARYWALAPAAWLCVATFFGAFVAYGGASQTLCAAAPTSSRAAADDHSVSARARARARAQSSHMHTQARTHACASTHGVVPAEADLPLHVANAFTHNGGGARSGVQWAPAGPT